MNGDFMSDRTMTSDTWLAVGEFWFSKDRRSSDPEARREFRFWCSRCRVEFTSLTTPTRCPNGCRAEDMDDRVMLTHKEYTAATFPFSVNQKSVMTK